MNAYTYDSTHFAHTLPIATGRASERGVGEIQFQILTLGEGLVASRDAMAECCARRLLRWLRTVLAFPHMNIRFPARFVNDRSLRAFREGCGARPDLEGLPAHVGTGVGQCARARVRRSHSRCCELFERPVHLTDFTYTTLNGAACGEQN
jgi:hypothetical protein